MDVVGAQYVSVKNVNCETTVDDFKSRWLAQEKLDAAPGLVSLRLVHRGPGGVPTAAQEAEALQSPTSLLADPSQTLAQAGVADGSWLVAVFVGQGRGSGVWPTLALARVIRMLCSRLSAVHTFILAAPAQTRRQAALRRTVRLWL